MEVYLMWAILAVTIAVLVLQFRKRPAEMPPAMTARFDRLEHDNSRLDGVRLVATSQVLLLPRTTSLMVWP